MAAAADRDLALLCIEVLSPGDTLNGTMVRCREYLQIGAKEAWIFDPRSRTVHVLNDEGTAEMLGGELQLPTTTYCVDIGSVFATLET